MWAIFRTWGHVIAVATAAVTPSADWMFVIRKMWWGLGTALSKRKSVQPSTTMVRRFSSSATGPRAGVLPLEMTPVMSSIFSDNFIRLSSFTLASVPAASSALTVSIFRFPRRPPCALISSAARMCPLYEGSPRIAAGPLKNVMWPTLYGVLGMFPFGGSAASAFAGPERIPAGTVAAAPTVPPSAFRKSLRLTSAIVVPPPYALSGRFDERIQEEYEHIRGLRQGASYATTQQ